MAHRIDSRRGKSVWCRSMTMGWRKLSALTGFADGIQARHRTEMSG